MTNWFSGIGQSASGINAARYGLSVVGQNMANAATVGYTRQTVQQSAVDGSAVNSLRSGTGLLGGVAVTATLRSTDIVLDARVRTEHSRSALASTTAGTLSDVDAALGGADEHGLSAQLDDFWNAWGDLADASTAGAGAARTALLKSAGTVASTLNTLGQQLADIADSTSSELASDVTAVNTAAGQLATVNSAIAAGTATGTDVNSLLDQRDQLLDGLSKLTGASITLDASGVASVSVGGQPLVSGTTASSMAADASAGITVGGQAVVVPAGSIGARVTALTTTLPGYQASLDAVADRLSSVVNTAQAAGYDANGSAGAAVFGGSGALGIHVVLTDPAGLAAASAAGSSDGGNARALSQQATATGSPDSLFTSLVATAATASAAATQTSATQSSVADTVDGLKSSMSGVSVDEEAAQMLVYQQAFNASSRVLTAMDDMLDTLINHTGTVGRA